MLDKELIIVRGGGDMATAVVHRLWRAGFRVLVLECAEPSAIRRQVAVSEAVYEGKTIVEDMTACKIYAASDASAIWEKGGIPVLIDPQGECIASLRPEVVIDAMIAKKNLGTHMLMAPLTVALGPGFCAGVDVHAVVETKRGHNLGRIIRQGCAAPNTGIPGNIGGYAAERVIHAQGEGRFEGLRRIGEYVLAGETIAMIRGTENLPVKATISGIIRGMIRDGYPVTQGFKIADIDPRREELSNCFTISDKARCIAGSVLELVCWQMIGKGSRHDESPGKTA